MPLIREKSVWSEYSYSPPPPPTNLSSSYEQAVEPPALDIYSKFIHQSYLYAFKRKNSDLYENELS